MGPVFTRRGVQGLNEFEELYQVLNEVEDLLTTGVRQERVSFADYRIQRDAPESQDPSVGDAQAGADMATPSDTWMQRSPDEAFLANTSTQQGPATEDPFEMAVNMADPVARQLRRYGDLSREERTRRLQELAEEIATCQRCPLAYGRKNAVPGEGVLDPLVLVVGEGPGREEDLQGRPFVGPAGKYLDKWLAAIGLFRESNVFIGNIVKCRPPNNRDPKPEESSACAGYLYEQIALIRPKLILTTGRISTRLLTGSTTGITRIHGTFYDFHGIPILPTFHPSAVLRNPEWRRPVWEDLKSLREHLTGYEGYSPPAEGSPD